MQDIAQTKVTGLNYSYKEIWTIAWPLILSGAGQMLNNVMDTAFMGRVGQIEIGAIALGVMYFFTLSMALIGFTVAIQIVIARTIGEGNTHLLHKYFWFALLSLSIASLFFMGIHYAFAKPILKTIIKSDSIYIAVHQFFEFRVFGFLTLALIFGFRSFYLGIANTKIIGITTVIIAVLNFIFNYWFVFGTDSLPAMGIKGSGLATTLAEFVGLLVLALYTFFNKKIAVKYLLLKISLPNKYQIKETLIMAVPLIFQFFITMFSWFAFFLIIEQTGEQNLAIANLTRNVYMISMVVLLAFASATSTIISNLKGQGKQALIFNVLAKIIALSLLITVIICSIMCFCIPQILQIFTSDTLLINKTLVSAFTVLGATLLFSVSYNLMSAVSGIGHTKASLLIECITIAIYLFFTYLLAITFAQPIEIVWLNEFIYFSLMGIICYSYLKYVLKQKV